MSGPPERWTEKAKWPKAKLTKKEKAVLVIGTIFAAIFWIVAIGALWFVLTNVIFDSPEYLKNVEYPPTQDMTG